MKVKVSLPQYDKETNTSISAQSTLFNESGIGLLKISENGEINAQMITGQGDTVSFRSVKTPNV